jgi:predicted DsbA family dithiol-disulfide isomerase
MSAADLTATSFSDPGCPYGFSAERQRLQLAWHYGLDVRTRMIVLREESIEWDDAPFSAKDLQRGNTSLRDEYGMPIDVDLRARLSSTMLACKAWVGAREAQHPRAGRFLRELRVRCIACGEELDQLAVVHAAAGDAGIDAATVDAWLADDAVEQALRADMAAARDPLPAALALPDKLAGPAGSQRYTAGSIVFERGDQAIVAPGFQPFDAWSLAVANLAPDLARRGPASDVTEVLEWAPMPLATAEVAALRGIDVAAAHAELARAGAHVEPAAQDGFWQLA